MNVTMTDIARAAQVSQSAVSLVLNGKSDSRVSQAKTELIRRTARELGFQVNMSAVCLRKQKTYTIGILLPSPRDTYYGELVADLQHLISRSDYTASFGFWENQAEAEKATANMLSRKVDALITCEPGYLPDGLDIPVVSFGVRDERYDSLCHDQEYSFQLRIAYLAELGHRVIDYVGGSAVDPRRTLFKNKLQDLGLVCRAPDFAPFQADVQEDNWQAQLMACFDRVWESSPRPTAIVAQNDVTAILIIRRAWERSIRVPGELSVIGFDDIPQSAVCVPSLTTVNKYPDITEAELLMDMIFRRMSEPNLPPVRHLSRSRLVLRESCVPPDLRNLKV